nr:hypothetical protein [Tanacetum cinerariifolium]
IQLQAEESDLMATVADLDEIEEVNANCIVMANLQQALTSGTQTNKAPVYYTDGSAELQAQLGDIKGKSKDTSCVSDTLNPLSQKLENENVELEFQVYVQRDNKRGTSTITKFAKQSILRKPPKLDETHALSKPVTSNSIPTPQESKVVKNDKVIAPGMFRINPFKTSREEKHVPNTASASNRTKPITVSQPLVFTKKDVNSDSNGLSSTGVDNTKTRRPRPRSNTKNDRVLFVSKSSCNKNKEVEQCLISVNHDVCLRNYVNGKTSRGKKQKANVSIKEKQKNNSQRWSPTRRLFDLKGKIIKSSESESQSDCSNGDNACTSNTLEPKIKRFPNSTSLLGRVYFVEGLGHNLFSVGQFCDSDLEVAFRRNAFFVRNLECVDLLSRNRTTNLYTINLHDMASTSPICLMARASSTKSWLWHQRLSHLNFDTISKRSCLSINVKRYVLVIVDDYTRYIWVHFLRSKDEAPETLVEAARTMLIFSRALLFLWAKAIATACFTQNRSIIHRRFNKTSYELFNGRKPDISFLHVFGALCYPKNDREDIGNLGTKGMTSRQISSGLNLTFAPSTITTQQPTKGELDLLFEAMYDDFIGGQPSAAQRTVSAAQAQQVCQTSTTSTSIADTVPTPTNSSSQATNFLISSQDVNELNSQQQHAQQQGNQAHL